MLVRAGLTAIDHNYNLNRPQAQTKNGELRYKLECNRSGAKYTVREIKVPKDNSWRDRITDFVMQVITMCSIYSLLISIFLSVWTLEQSLLWTFLRARISQRISQRFQDLTSLMLLATTSLG